MEWRLSLAPPRTSEEVLGRLSRNELDLPQRLAAFPHSRLERDVSAFSTRGLVRIAFDWDQNWDQRL
jgi:hypothetical protein